MCVTIILTWLPHQAFSLMLGSISRPVSRSMSVQPPLRKVTTCWWWNCLLTMFAVSGFLL